MNEIQSPPPSTSTYYIFYQAAIYVLSGVTQPLLMSLAKNAGLADPTCQLYMLFYYIGPAAMIFTFCYKQNPNMKKHDTATTTTISTTSRSSGNPNTTTIILKTIGIASVDILAQTMNYTGSTMAGPTIFAIIYSSVTVWCAILSRLLLSRRMSYTQWTGVFLVFGGLIITAIGSISLGPNVYHGAALVTVGSALHALMYVLSESVMKHSDIPHVQYCAIFGCVGTICYFTWQIVYTRVHFTTLILTPMEESQTSYQYATLVLLSIAFMSLIHSITFFFTVKHIPGGATSAGVMKALQAVLVFVATSVVFCGRLGGNEMCFTATKFISLVVVVMGVVIFGYATDEVENRGRVGLIMRSNSDGSGVYERVGSVESLPGDATRTTTTLEIEL